MGSVLTGWMDGQGENALTRGEVPVGAVFVYKGEIIARASNRTNELYNVRRG